MTKTLLDLHYLTWQLDPTVDNYMTLMEYSFAFLNERLTDNEKELIESSVAPIDGEYNFTHKKLREAAGDDFPIIEDLLRGLTMSEVAKLHKTTKSAIEDILTSLRAKEYEPCVN